MGEQPFPAKGNVDDLVAEVTFRRLVITLREQLSGPIAPDDAEVETFTQRLGELNAREDGRAALAEVGIDFRTASFEQLRAALKDHDSDLSGHLPKGPLKNSPDITWPSGTEMAECFLAGTPILMADGSEKPIEEVRTGDRVMAFDPAADRGRGACVPRPVARTFRNRTRQVVDLRGLRCTPGHVFLSGETDARGRGVFKTIAALLREDGTLVGRDGHVRRARTGARLGSVEDIPVRVVYRDPASGAARSALVRAGVPAVAEPCEGAEGGEIRVWSLAQWSARQGIAVLEDGRLRNGDGALFEAGDWPAGSTPFDAPDARNWIVAEPDGQPYTPPWIVALVEEREEAASRAAGAATPS